MVWEWLPEGMKLVNRRTNQLTTLIEWRLFYQEQRE